MYSNPIYRENNTLSNNYIPLMGQQNCAPQCQTNYSNPYAKVNCPSSCNYFEEYSSLNGMYDTYIPPSTKSRIIPSPSLVYDYQVANPRLVNFAGQVQDASGQATAQAQSIEGFHFIQKKPMSSNTGMRKK